MKILLLINSLSAGGAEVFTANLALQYKKLGHQVKLFAYAGILDKKGIALQNQLSEAGIAVFTGHKKILKSAFELRNLIRTFNPDVIHSNLEQSDTVLLLAAPLKWTSRSLRVRTIHNEYATQRIPKIIHHALKQHFDLTVCCSSSVAHTYPYLCKKTVVIKNGLQKPQATKPCETALLHPRNFDTSFVTIGSFTKRNGALQKSQDIILEAIKIISHLNFRVIFVGGGSELQALKDLSIKNGTAEHCLFLGIQDDPLSILKTADAFLLPSRFEGMPISCLEAIACTKPMILSKIPSLLEFNFSSTLFCKPESAEDLADKIAQFIAEKHYFIDLAMHELPKVFEQYDIENCASQYIEHYRANLKPNSGEINHANAA
jgi:glycosyltransferase involved in cell wall biosynthesis